MKRKSAEESGSAKLTVKITPRGSTKRQRKKKVARRELQVPLREKDLLTTDAFIRYCNDYRVTTDRAELEYFEKEVLLLPAVRIYLGLVEFKKVLADFDGKEAWRYVYRRDVQKMKVKHDVKAVDRRVYYSSGALCMGEPGWLSLYMKRGLVKHPAKQRTFQPWEYYKRAPQRYTTDPKTLENAAEALYSKLQLYTLKAVQWGRRLLIKNEMMFQPEEEWTELGHSVAEGWNRERVNESARRRVVEYHMLFELIASIEALWADYYVTYSEKWDHLLEEYGGDVKAVEADLRGQREPLDSYLVPTAKRVLKRHRYSLRNLEIWQLRILEFGSFDMRSKATRAYVRFLDKDALVHTEDPYAIVGLLGWFIRLCGGKGHAAKELLLRSSNYRHCTYCGRAYSRRRIDQKTCGSPECVRARSKELKRIGRKSRKYDY
jgi:hypothetical protein